MKYEINEEQIIDDENNIIFDLNDADITKICYELNKEENEKLEYKRQLRTLKHRIKKLVEDYDG